MKNKKGFTLVELVIVIAVIGILAAILIPTFTNVARKANKAVISSEYTIILDGIKGDDTYVNGINDIYDYCSGLVSESRDFDNNSFALSRDEFVNYLKNNAEVHDEESFTNLKTIPETGVTITFTTTGEGENKTATDGVIKYTSEKGKYVVEIRVNGLYLDDVKYPED